MGRGGRVEGKAAFSTWRQKKTLSADGVIVLIMLVALLL